MVGRARVDECVSPHELLSAHECGSAGYVGSAGGGVSQRHSCEEAISDHESHPIEVIRPLTERQPSRAYLFLEVMGPQFGIGIHPQPDGTKCQSPAGSDIIIQAVGFDPLAAAVSCYHLTGEGEV